MSFIQYHREFVSFVEGQDNLFIFFAQQYSSDDYFTIQQFNLCEHLCYLQAFTFPYNQFGTHLKEFL